MLEFCDWKSCLDTLPFVSSLHMNVTNGRMKELHSTTWPNYQADIGQMGDYSTKCHTPEDVKKKLFSHLSVCTLPFDSLPYDCAPRISTKQTLKTWWFPCSYKLVIQPDALITAEASFFCPLLLHSIEKWLCFLLLSLSPSLSFDLPLQSPVFFFPLLR